MEANRKLLRAARLQRPCHRVDAELLLAVEAFLLTHTKKPPRGSQQRVVADSHNANVLAVEQQALELNLEALLRLTLFVEYRFNVSDNVGDGACARDVDLERLRVVSDAANHLINHLPNLLGEGKHAHVPRLVHLKVQIGRLHHKRLALHVVFEAKVNVHGEEAVVGDPKVLLILSVLFLVTFLVLSNEQRPKLKHVLRDNELLVDNLALGASLHLAVEDCIVVLSHLRV
mmetsp:Transcript_30077/g.73735  ORF Transcript_30077/g.73735 Transcript_30077/m.73735 type:complete len:230 (-) Transcript_30077:786-1475(-)